jgi:hypothetical protein
MRYVVFILTYWLNLGSSTNRRKGCKYLFILFRFIDFEQPARAGRPERAVVSLNFKKKQSHSNIHEFVTSLKNRGHVPVVYSFLLYGGLR